MCALTERRHAEFVQPFYLDMMRTNAVEHGSELVPAIVEAGRAASADDVIALLRDPWRATVMGAWLAVLFDEQEVTEAVLKALGSSHGSLDSPPLTTAAVVLAGRDALPTIVDYSARDASNQWGACGFAAAAVEHLGGTTASCQPHDSDRLDLTAMLALAERLRASR